MDVIKGQLAYKMLIDTKPAPNTKVDHLVKASSRKTPQPSPISLSEAQSSPYIAGTTGITQRVAALRGECLKRDRHRCVISGRFDDAEALERVEREGDDEAKDDDGHKLKKEAGTFAPLEVAHILGTSRQKSVV